MMKRNASSQRDVVRSIAITVPDTVADGVIDHVVRAVERLTPADRDEVLERLSRALATMLGPKYLRVESAPPAAPGASQRLRGIRRT
jgi:hypothetical protein